MQNKIQIIEEKYRQSTQVLIEEKNGQFEIQIQGLRREIESLKLKHESEMERLKERHEHERKRWLYENLNDNGMDDL